MVTIANLRERYLAGETSPGRFVGEVYGTCAVAIELVSSSAS